MYDFDREEHSYSFNANLANGYTADSPNSHLAFARFDCTELQ